MEAQRMGAFAAFALVVSENGFAAYGGIVGVRLVTERPDPARDLAR